MQAQSNHPAHDYPAHDHPAHDYPAHDYPAHDYPAHDHPAHDHPAHDHPAHDHPDVHSNAHEDHPHPHDHDHGHDHARDHDHPHGSSVWGWVVAVFHLHGHSHEHGDLATDQAFVTHAEGIRTVWLALAALGFTALLQIIIVVWSGSVSLLADTLHNIGDTLNSIPLLIAFYLARRQATRRYTYGFAKA